MYCTSEYCDTETFQAKVMATGLIRNALVTVSVLITQNYFITGRTSGTMKESY